MTNSKNTKRALLTSVFSLLICVAMLIGTTYAWFTDTASTGINKIQSGNLDVVLEVATEFNDVGEPTAWEEVTTDTKLFKDVNGNDILWEPGAGTQEIFRIRNNGTLALKYQFMTNYNNATKTAGGKTLADILKVQTVALNLETEDNNGRNEYADITGAADAETGFAPMNNARFEEYLLPGESRTIYTCIVWLPTENDNDFNVAGGLSIDLGINVLATQYTYENDASGDQYDKDADYDTIAVTADELKAIMTPVNGVITLEKNYIVTTNWTSMSIAGRDVYDPQYVGKITINGNGHYIASLTTALLADNFCTDLVVNDLTIKNSNISYTSPTSGANGAFIGYMNAYPVTFNNCHIENVTVNGAEGKNVQVGGFAGQLDMAAVTITNCSVRNSVINANSSAGGFVGILMTNDGIEKTVSGCKVINSKITSGNADDWRVGAIVGTANGNGTLKIVNCFASGNAYTMPNSDAINPGHEMYGRTKGTAQIVG